MKAQAAKPTQKAARSERAPPVLSPMATPLAVNEFAVQRKSCACGGSCPRCQQDDFRIQPKLEVGPVGDAYEQEADRVAEQVMRTPAPSLPETESTGTKIQRACTTCGENKQEDEPEPESELIQRAPLSATSAEPPPAGTGQSAGSIDRGSLVSGGHPLASSTREFYESRFNRDLSAVRLHTGAAANDHCDNLNAHAFTYGNHVWLGKRLSASPSFVMAHELAHVVQQTQPETLRRKENKDHADTDSLSRSPTAKIQRLPFWVPIDTREGDITSGSEIHRELLGQVSSDIHVEAPVPNATRAGWGLGLQGYADLYRAKSRVGVYFEPRTGLQVGDQHGDNRFTKPAKTSRAGSAPAPTVARGKIQNINTGPKKIELGELKPAALTELTKGHQQLNNYIDGFNDAAALTNLWAAGQSSKESWKLNSNVTRLSDSAIPAMQSAERPLALADIDEVSPEGKKKETVKYKVKKIFLPRWYLGQEIPGRLHMEPFGQGLWMYYARPNDFAAALNVPTFRVAEKQAYMGAAQAVQDEVIGNLARGPEKITLFPRYRQAPAIQTHATPLQLRRKPKQTKLKDPFDDKALEAWNRRQSELGKEIHGDGDAKGDKKSASTFKKLEFLQIASQAQQNATSKAQAPKFPTQADLAETITSVVDGKTVQTPKNLDKMFNWMERWTSPAYKIFGQFRLRFGSVFIKAVNFLSKFKNTVAEKVKKFFDEGSKKTGTASALVKALTVGLKQVVHLIVPHTFSLVQDAIVNGIKKKMKTILDDSFVGQTIDKVKGWYDDIKDYGDKAEEYIEDIKKKFLDKFDWLSSLLSDLKWFWRIIKIGRGLLTCAKRPPILSCARLLFSGDKDINCILCIPWVQKQIADKVMAVSWFRSIPVKLGNIVLDVLRAAVPKNAETLKEVLNENIPDSMPSSEDITPECNEKCDGYGFFKAQGAGGEVVVKPGEADAMEKMGDFAEEHTKEEVDDMVKEAERQGLQDQPFDKKKAEELLEEAKKKSGQGKPDKPAPPPPKAKDDPAKPPKDKRPPDDKDKDKLDQPPPGQRKPTPPPVAPTPTPDVKPAPGQNSKQGPGGTCTWSASDLRLEAWLLESTGKPGYSTTLDHTTADGRLKFAKDPLKRECAIKLDIKNDFPMATASACGRAGAYTPPIVSTEITFESKATSQKKTLFKETDKNPKTTIYQATPFWGPVIQLKDIEESGTLSVKITMQDPDSGKFLFIVDHVNIEVVTQKQDPKICCRCVS